MPLPGSLTPVQRPPKLPIVLCHGLLGFDKIGVKGFVLGRYFNGIQDDLVSQGCRVVTTEVAPSSSVSVRAAELREQVSKIGGKVHLIAHSMGGLDVRYMISSLGGHEFVSSLTTISTPHRGSPMADWGLENLEVVGELLQLFGMGTDAFENLSQKYCKEEFNPANPDHPDVKYFSYGGAKDFVWTFPPLMFSHNHITKEEGPNDGLVSVRSAKWGIYRETLNADHIDLINWGPRYDAKGLYRDAVEGLED